MAGQPKYSHDKQEMPDKVGSSLNRYVVVYVDNDNDLHPIIERKSNGQSFHMTFKTLTVARRDAFGVSDAQPEDYPDDRVAVYDKQYGVVL